MSHPFNLKTTTVKSVTNYFCSESQFPTRFAAWIDGKALLFGYTSGAKTFTATETNGGMYHMQASPRWPLDSQIKYRFVELEPNKRIYFWNTGYELLSEKDPVFIPVFQFLTTTGLTVTKASAISVEPASPIAGWSAIMEQSRKDAMAAKKSSPADTPLLHRFAVAVPQVAVAVPQVAEPKISKKEWWSNYKKAPFFQSAKMPKLKLYTPEELLALLRFVAVHNCVCDQNGSERMTLTFTTKDITDIATHPWYATHTTEGEELIRLMSQ